MKKRILHIILAIMLMAVLLPTAVTVVSAWTYTASDSALKFRVEDHAGNLIADVGGVTLSGYYYHNGNTEIVTDPTVPDRSWEVTHVRYASFDYDFSKYDAEITNRIAYIYDFKALQTFSYSFDKFDFGSKYVKPANGTFLSASPDTNVTIKVDRKDVGLTLALTNAAGQSVTSGVTVTVNGQTDSSSPYTFSNMQEGKSYTVTVTGSGYDYSGSYTIERKGADSQSGSVNIGTATFDVYAQVQVGGKAFTGATVTGGGKTLTNKDSLYHTKLPTGSVTLSATAAGVTISNASETVTSAGISQSSPLILNGTLDTPTVTGADSTIPLGSTTQLSVSNKVSGASYTWSGSDPSVATVDANGKVTPLKEGSINITVTCTFGNASATKTVALTTVQGTADMPELSEIQVGTWYMIEYPDKFDCFDTDIQEETFRMPDDLKDSYKVDITAVCTDSKGAAVNATRTIENPKANEIYKLDFGVKLKGPVTYTIVFKSNTYKFNQASRTMTRTYYHSPGSVAPKLTQTEFVYTGEAVKPELNGGDSDSYTVSGYSIVTDHSYAGLTVEAELKSNVQPVEVTALQTHTYKTIYETSAQTHYNCPYAVKIVGNEANYYKGTVFLRFTITPRPLTVKAKDQSIPYASTELDTTALEITSGSLLSGHTLSGTVAVDANDSTKLNVVSAAVTSDPADSKLASRYSITTQSGTLTTTQNTATAVTINGGYKTEYTYGDSISAPAFTVFGAYESDVKLKWYNKTAETIADAHPWDSGAPKNVGTYVIVAYTEENSNTAASSDSVDITIIQKSISGVTVSDIADKTYTGEELTPALTVKDGTTPLTEGTDYTVEYRSNVVVGEATVTISGIGNYKDTKEVTFQIIKADWTAKTVSGSAMYNTKDNELTFTDCIAPGGTVGAPSAKTENILKNVSVTDGVLTYDVLADVTDKSVVVKIPVTNATNHKDYEITVTIALYPKPSQTITAANAAEDKLTFTYGDTDAAISASSNAADTDISYAVTEGDCITVDAASGKITINQVGTAVITVTASETNSYAKTTKAVTIEITAKPIAAPSADSTTFVYNGKEQTYGISAADGYTVSGNKQTNAGTHTVTAELTDKVNTVWADTKDAVNKEYSFVIKKAALIVTAVDKEAYVGNRIPKLTYKTVGLLDGDTINVELSCDVNMNRDGEADIVVVASDPNGNYEITTVNGTLTVKYYPFIPIIKPAYPPVVNGGDNGNVSVSPENPKQGDTVTIVLDPDAGYEADEIIVTDKDGNPVTVTPSGDGTYSFKQPSGKVTITATFKEIIKVCPRDSTCPMYGCTDLDRAEWYHDGVHYCIEHGLMQGVGNSKFNPDGTTTRAMIITILWRLEGSPVVNYAMDFEDVDADYWYTEAIRWAASEKIVEGYGDGKLGTDDVITREQLATILYRYEQSKGGGFTGAWMIRMDYVDLADISDWAYEAMCWMNMNGVVNGRPGKVLDPKGTATRAEAAAMLQRYCEITSEED